MNNKEISISILNNIDSFYNLIKIVNKDRYKIDKSLTEKQMAEIFQMAEVFRFLIKDMGKDSLLIEAIRTETKNDSILKVFKERYTNIEVVRGGPVAIDCISMQDR